MSKRGPWAWHQREAIAEDDFNLAASPDEPRAGEEAPRADPADLIRQMLRVEYGVAKRLETSLATQDGA